MYPAWIVLSVLVTLGGAVRFNCRGRILGAYYADAKSGCKAFHVCVRVAGGGVRDFRFFCPPGTLFHQEAQTCTDWGDDDPLACPADLYDGQFDLYKIGSGFDTKKLAAPAKSEDEPEFGLQRAETGDRRLQHSGASDLRTAHSSDFFSGQRDRGRDDSPPPPAPPAPPSSSSSRQSFRRATTPRSTSSTTQYTTPPPPPPQRQTSKQYDVPAKPRKLLRKRPVYTPASTPPAPLPTTYSPTYNPSTQNPLFPDTNRNQQPQYKPTQQPQYKPTVPQPSVPPQFKEFKDEYVEVSRVTPKTNKYFLAQSTGSPQFSISTTAAPFSKKEGLVELFTYDTKSTPSNNAPNANRPFKIRNSFNVVPEAPIEDFVRTKALNNNNAGRNPPSTVDYNNAPRVTTNTPYRNFNSVSYEPEKNNYVSPGAKQNYNYFNVPSTTAVTTTYYTTTRSEPPAHFNTVAYNTNNDFHALKTNFGQTNDDDGQYRLPHGEDDGQYRPELYERDSELLSGAHSLNIAASGNRLPDDQKSYSKSQNFKPVAQTAAPRPFRPAPTPSASTASQPEVTYTTTFRPPTVNTQRTFDYYQTYTTTLRPETPAVSQYVPVSNVPVRPSTTPSVARTPEPARERPQNRAPVPSTSAPAKPAKPVKPSTQAPHFAHPANNKEDNSYDYAYYDSDPGFSEYDHIEEFGKTKSKA